jgi:small subunit ribosomal protein S4
MRYTGPKARLCRRFGVNLFGTEKYTKILTKRPTKPGQHGPTGKFGKMNDYGRQLLEKQKAKIVFGLSERQLQNYVEKALKMPGDTSEELLRLFELRIDNAVYISQIAVTRVQARQMVSHGHFMLNGRRVDVPSIQLRVGDKIQLRDRLKNSALYAELAKLKEQSPKWLKVDLKAATLEVVGKPEKDELEKSIDSQSIIEFYSR